MFPYNSVDLVCLLGVVVEFISKKTVIIVFSYMRIRHIDLTIKDLSFDKHFGDIHSTSNQHLFCHY